MHPILKMLLEGLELEESEGVVSRVDAMNREFTYLQQNKPDLINKATELGWTSSKLAVVFCLNSFYQRIIAPLYASVTAPSEIGSRIPIRYGKSILFDAERNRKVAKMAQKFGAICKKAQVNDSMLNAQKTGDLIWRITHKSEEFDENNARE